MAFYDVFIINSTDSSDRNFFVLLLRYGDTSDQSNSDTAISDQIVLIAIDRRYEKTAIYKPAYIRSLVH